MTPNLTWYARRSWLVQAVASAQVECIIIDDAQDLELAHLAFLKELTDNLTAPPYERHVSLCLVTAHSGNIIPFKEVFARPDTLWLGIATLGYRASFLCCTRTYTGGGEQYSHHL